MKILTVLGTRPEIIRLSIITQLLDKYFNHKIIHTGQNYSSYLKDIFYKQLNLREPDIFFNSKSKTLSEQISKILINCEKIFKKEKPNKILILGDTNSALSSIIAKRMGIPVYHLEAGNRCFDDTVPEEINRKIIDHCSTILLPYTEQSKENLLKEGIDKKYIYVVGNPIYEVITKYITINKSDIYLEKYNLKKENYFLVTLHREENVDNPKKLYNLISFLEKIYNIYKKPIIFPIHPRTKNRIKKFNIPIFNVSLINPISFIDFIHLEINAFCILTDSGTVQEEACIFNIPNVTLRNTTERPETIECGSNIISGYNKNDIITAIKIATSNRNKKDIPKNYLKENVSYTVLNILASTI
jgi:UDP-N-acetylglucosamine 2-epimerase (non-hydrolysing)